MSDPTNDTSTAPVLDPGTALELARAAAVQAAAVAGDPNVGTTLVPTGPDAALAVKRQMAAGLAQAAKARAAAVAKVNEAREAIKAQTAALEAQLRAVEAELAPVQKMVARMTEGLWSMNLYMGRDEEIVTLREGKPAPAGTPIYVRQQVLAMDEECVYAAETGGMDVRDIAAFDAWLLADPAHLDQLLPEPRGVVAVIARRAERDYGDPWANAELNAQNKTTWWLLRNGEQVSRMVTDFNVGSRLTPAADEFTSMFVDRWTKEPLRPGTEAWVKAEEAAGARERHYMRVALVLQGLCDRTSTFAPLPRAGLNLLAPQDYDDGHVVLIADDEHQLTTGRTPFYTWLAHLNGQLTPGMRVMVATAHHRWPSLTDRYEHPRIHPPRAEAPRSGQVYTIARRGPAAGEFVITYPRTQQEWMRGPDGREELRVPKTSASCQISSTDPFVLPIDLVDVPTMRTYMAARTERHAYADMFPLLAAAIAFKEAEAAAEAPFRGLLAAQVAAREGVDLDAAHKLIDPVIATWKVGARWFRPLHGDPEVEKRAGVAILAERARIAAANAGTDTHADTAFVTRALAEHRDALLVARKKDGTYVVLTPTPRAWTAVDPRWGDRVVPDNVWLTRHEYTKTGKAKTSTPWTLVAPATLSRWIVLHEAERWTTWDKGARAGDHLTDPEIWAVIEDLRAEHVPGMALMAVSYEEDPTHSVRDNPKRFTAWYHPGPVTVPARPLTGYLPYLYAHTRTLVSTRERDGSISVTRGRLSTNNTTVWAPRHNTLLDPTKTSQSPAPWESDRRSNQIAWVDQTVLAEARADADARELARLREAALAQTAHRLWDGLERDWTTQALAAAKARFLEDFADEELWDPEAARKKLRFPYERRTSTGPDTVAIDAAWWALCRLVEEGRIPWGLTLGEAVDQLGEPLTRRVHSWAGEAPKWEVAEIDLPDALAGLHLAEEPVA